MLYSKLSNICKKAFKISPVLLLINIKLEVIHGGLSLVGLERYDLNDFADYMCQKVHTYTSALFVSTSNNNFLKGIPKVTQA